MKAGKLKCRQLVTVLCIACMLFLVACGGQAAETGDSAAVAVNEAVSDAAGSESPEAQAGTLTVQVESIDGNTVTAASGTLEQQAMPGGGDMPEGDLPGGNGEMPEMPEGFEPGADGEMPEIPEGGTPGGDGEAPEMPEGGMPGGDGERPEMPEGGTPGGDGEAPEMPEGGMPGGGAQFLADGETVTFTLTDDTIITVEFLAGSQDGTADDIAVGSVLEVQLDADGTAAYVNIKNLSAGGGFGGSGAVTNGTSANTISNDSTVSGETFTSFGDDENALRVDGATVTLENVTIEKTGGESSNTEDGDFYGQNAAFLALNGATVEISGATVNTSAVNGNGIFSYGEGTTVNVSDSTIRTTENNSGGIQTTGGAYMNATNLDVETQGNSAAAIRTDRGGGTVTVNGGTYSTSGTGSPAVYSTADITVSDATLTATASEAVVVEGQNSVTLENCTVTGNMQGTYGSTEKTSGHIHNIMIYQSMSGDAEVGHAAFAATGGSITAQQGDMFYITNTSCIITLSGVELTLANDVLLSVEGNDASRGWGTAGANGGDVSFTAQAQQLTGNIHVDEISTLELALQDGSSFTGSINSDGQKGAVAVTLGADSTWTLTADCYITSFDGDIANVTADGYTLYVNGEAIN